MTTAATEPIRREPTTREFEGEWIDGGYEFIGVGHDNGWSPIAGWGRDGWDLGSWPYAIVLFRDRILTPSTLDNDPAEKLYERAIYVEGDIVVETYATSADRQAATDATALFYWQADEAAWLDRDPADLSGPFSWARLDQAEQRS